MSGVTGIELGPDYCVLVRGGRLGPHRTVLAAGAIPADVWPSDRDALVAKLRDIRERHDLSPRARVVAWNEDASLAPLADAGFEVTSVLTPAQALGRVAHARQVGAPAGTAAAALSINTHGVAIAIVAGSDVICSRTLEWPLGRPFSGARPELLERYLLVSQLAPQLEHLMAFVRPAYGVVVTSVVVCGNLPALRSLAMLLIEELDVEVETLDSTELLGSRALAAEAGDAVPSLQLAAAVASSAENRVPVHVSEEAVAPAPGAEVGDRGVNRLRTMTMLAAVVAMMVSTSWSMMQVTGSSPARAVFPGGLLPPVIQIQTAAPIQLERGAQDFGTEATLGRESGRSVETTGRSGRIQPASGLPSVDGILISGQQRLAIVSGEVVAAGDVVGARAVARIERGGVVLRDRAGREIYVAIRIRKPPPLGS